MYNVYLGCYTHQNTSQDGESSQGIYLLKIDENGILKDRKLASVVTSPSYFYLTKDNSKLFAVTEAPNEKGKILCYAVGKEGELTLLSERTAAGGGLCHVMMDPEEKYLVVTCYEDATIQSYPVEDGKITPMFSLRHHLGSGPVLERQEAAHTHSVTMTPDGAYAVVCDLGTDMLNVYTIGAESGKLHRAIKMNFVCPPGCGPRHMVFSPNGKYAYVACELSSEILVLSYDREKGFELISKVSTLSPEYGVSHNFPAAIRITKDGRFIYLSNRGEDTIAIFKVDPETGLIVLQMSASTRGWYPRDFILTKDEKFLIAANQLSDNLVIYERDLRTGLLSLTDEKPMPQKPIALEELA